jgi:hypothetical protein
MSVFLHRILWVVAAGAFALMADQPLPAPSDQKLYSHNKRYYIFLSAKEKRGTAYNVATGSKLWEIDGWFRVTALADDGEHFITGYDGGTLVPSRYDPKMTMLTFYRRGKPFRSLTLEELVPDMSKLQPASSHLYWGYYAGFENGLYRVDTVDRGTLFFDPKTGELASHSQQR